MSRSVIILFTRIPRLGVGKRRLAREVGDRKALNFAWVMLHRLLHRLQRLRGVECVLAISPDHHSRLRAPGFTKIGQGRGDLGQRMQRAFNRYARRRVVLIGSDIPGIRAADVRTALHSLGGNDAVFGPTVDGGYWLVGMSGRRPGQAFFNVRWSSRHALADTEKNFLNHQIKRLRQLDDVDDATSLAVQMQKAHSHA